jgi:proteasome lid subunit RPN8/RPN11/archaellum component FlaC
MSSEITFGEVEQNEPQIAVRPDRDAHYSVATVGDVNISELPIFVDLDVQRDMEAHAHTNTRVELGGVMLGKQCIDAHGKPFVIVTDSLRARHYEATRGSFKFTHETWSQITGERNQYHPDLEMVGWYHTHPGWTVFLSPMDLFICDNFFNRQLDVALVIDPCNDDRGWFQWNEEHKTQRTGGFYLTSNRYREDELNYFASLYNHEPTMNSDPRYSGYHIGTTTPTQAPAMNNRKPWFDLMMVAMMLTQLVFIGVMLTQLSRPAIPAVDNSQLETSGTRAESVQTQSLKLALAALAESKGQEQIANRLVELETDRKLLAANLDGQLARVELVSRDNDALRISNRTAVEKTADLESQIGKLKTELAAAKKAAKSKTNDGAILAEEANNLPWLIGSSMLGLLLGGGLMFFFGRKEQEELYEPPQRELEAGAKTAEQLK